MFSRLRCSPALGLRPEVVGEGLHNLLVHTLVVLPAHPDTHQSGQIQAPVEPEWKQDRAALTRPQPGASNSCHQWGSHRACRTPAFGQTSERMSSNHKEGGLGTHLHEANLVGFQIVDHDAQVRLGSHPARNQRHTSSSSGVVSGMATTRQEVETTGRTRRIPGNGAQRRSKPCSRASPCSDLVRTHHTQMGAEAKEWQILLDLPTMYLRSA